MVDDGEPVARLAPVTYLPGVTPAREIPARWTIPLEDVADSSDTAARFRAGDESDDESDLDADAGGSSTAVAEAEDVLAKRLRRSALSEREARTFLAQQGVASTAVEVTIARFIDRRWLDDAALAEQLVYAGTSRKGQGRRAIAQAISARGISREIGDIALDSLPDDDSDRALEYARSKAHGLRSYDVETAVRRLMGQLARRGYPGSVASTAARTAIAEARGSGSGGNSGRSGGVQFR